MGFIITAYKILSQNFKGEHSANLSVDGKIILNWILQK